MASGTHNSNSSLETQAKRAGWYRFSLVESGFAPGGRKLYRSSAPSYRKLYDGNPNDSSQRLTPAAVDFLVKQKIDSIISFNQFEYKPDEKASLAASGITYLHLPVEDYHAPTFGDLMRASTFFMGTSSMLLHCGYGHGRTGTGITALQIWLANGQTLEPYASTWWGSRGNHVEKRRQMSVLAELRNTLLQNRAKGTPDIGSEKQFAIINFATGYYLKVAVRTRTVSALSPEVVEVNASTRARRERLWIISKKASNNFQLSNSATNGRFAATKSNGASVNDPVTIETGEGVNTQFTFTEVQGDGDGGFYIISPSSNRSLAIAINEPDDNLGRLDLSREMPAILTASDERNKFGLWVLFPVYL